MSKIAGLGDPALFQGNGLDEVVPHVHHEVHRSGFELITAFHTGILQTGPPGSADDCAAKAYLTGSQYPVFFSGK
jgi:hypothetical protein